MPVRVSKLAKALRQASNPQVRETSHPAKTRRYGTSKIALTAFLLLWMLPAFAQDQPAQDSQTQEQDQGPTFKVNVNVVNIYFNVKDKHGALIPDLKKEDFQVLEDGKPQTIKYFHADSEQPLTMGILIDCSGSQQRVLPMTQDIGSQFLADVLRPKDEAFLISFDIQVELVQDFTSETKLLARGLHKTRINVGGGSYGVPGIGQGPIPVSNPKGTLLYDAIYLASNEKLKEEVGRKALIILTDGEDQGSKTTLREAIEAAQKSDAIVYVIFEADRMATWGSGKGDMKKVAEETGGRVIDVGDNPKKLKEAFDEISKELRSQYYIGYTPANQKRDGSYRKVEVKPTDKDLKIQARKGYYAPGGSDE
jgi:VWFA-related protein